LGKVAIVTGANRGIGRAIAIRLASAGVKVVLTARDARLLADTAAEIRAAGGAAHEISADLRAPAAPGQIVQAAIAAFGRLDILINNAGATKRGRFQNLTDDDWADGFALKFFGAVRLIRAAWSHLQARQGSIVNIAGIGGRTPGAEFALGGSVNAALLSLTKALAEQGLADGVRVNAINPGRVKTERLQRRLNTFADEHGLSQEQAEADMLAEAGISRFGEPREIAELVAYLVSEKGAFFQGSLLDIDGGETKTL
jgi:3-oxoacyl-[acyl-carrier protein] reductase